MFDADDSKRLPKIFCHVQIFLLEIEVTTVVIEDITEDTIIVVTTEVIEDITEDTIIADTTIWCLGGSLTGLLLPLQKNHQLKIEIVEDDLDPDPDQDLVQDRQIGDLKEVKKIMNLIIMP